MKKNYLFLLLALGLATSFSACSDDDDDDKGNGKGAGNGGSGVTVLSKKVAKVESMNADGSVEDTYLFKYDAEGKLLKVIDQYGNYSDEKEYIYGDNKITVKEDGEESAVITLKDGRAVSYEEKDGETWKSDYTFSYKDKFLSQSVCKESQLINDVWKLSYTTTSDYTVKDNNLVSLTVQSDEDETPDTGTIEHGKVANNANIDLNYICLDFEEEDLLMLCVLGNRYQNLPSKITSSDTPTYQYTANYTYEVDKEGYVTKITIQIVEVDGGHTYNDTDVYKITYE